MLSRILRGTFFVLAIAGLVPKPTVALAAPAVAAGPAGSASGRALPRLTGSGPHGVRGPQDPRPEGYFKQEAIWIDHTINVCWHMTAARYEATRADRHLVTAAIAGSWERVAAVKFAGWRRCGASVHNGFGIDEADVNPSSAALGNELDGNLDGVTFDFEYRNFSTNFCLSQKAYCDKLIAIHEFGHTLGLAHEQNRADTPKGPECTQDPQGENGDVTVGTWDLASVMNYCNPQWNGDGDLSAVDVQTIQQMYGANGAPTTSAIELHFPTRIVSGSCEIDNASISLFPDGRGEFDAGVRSSATRPQVDGASLALKDRAGIVVATVPAFDSPVLTSAQQLWHATFRFAAGAYASIDRANLFSNLRHGC